MPPVSSSRDLSGGRLPRSEESSRDWIRSDTFDTKPSGAGREPDIKLPGYQVIAEMARGTAAVYKARFLRLDRLVALKQFPSATPDRRARFLAATRQLSEFEHPNIAQVYDVLEYDNRAFLALEYIDGATLAQWLVRTPPSPYQAATVLEPLARAIAAAHSRGIVHGALRPGSILLGKEQTPPSIAEALSSLPSPSSLVPKVMNFGVLELLGAGGLSPTYLAPEQLAGRAAEPATDIYALGVILYEMLTGRPPFEGSSTAETTLLVRTLEPVEPRRLRPSVPLALESICLKCLEKEPSHRYRSAAELAEDLTRFLSNRPIAAQASDPLTRARRWRQRYPKIASVFTGAMLVLLGTTLGFVLARMLGNH